MHHTLSGHEQRGRNRGEWLRSLTQHEEVDPEDALTMRKGATPRKRVSQLIAQLLELDEDA